MKETECRVDVVNRGGPQRLTGEAVLARERGVTGAAERDAVTGKLATVAFDEAAAVDQQHAAAVGIRRSV